MFFFETHACSEMDETSLIFQSFWKLILSQLTHVNDEASSWEQKDKLMKDMLSSTFGKALETASPEEKTLFIETLRQKSPFLARNSVEKACLEILVAWLNGQPAAMSCESVFLDSLLNDETSCSLETIFAHLESPLVSRVLSGMDSDMRERFVRRVEQVFIPKLKSDGDRIRLLSVCPVLTSEIEALMTRSINEIADWFQTSPKLESCSSSQLELTLAVIEKSPRIMLFKQLSNIPVLKEQFMVTLAVAIRRAGSIGIPTQTIQNMFFLIPSVGVVMDRWLDKELSKYNKDVVGRIKEFMQVAGQGHQKGSNQMREALGAAFPINDEVYIVIPYGLDAVISSFIAEHANDDGKFKPLPCALSEESAGTVLKFFPTWFEVTAGKARLTPAALAAIKKEMNRTAGDVAVVSAPAQPDDLIDILLREILNKLPEHAFLTRPYPSKVQPGVYRFGTREVTFHAKGGVLYVFRVGGYVSESEAGEFIAREFGVKPPSENPAASSGNRRPPPPSSRRPMEWDNESFLIRLLKRGLKANDALWREGWESICRSEGLDPKELHSKETLARFVELHLAHATKQPWARDLLYHVDKEDDSSGLESDGKESGRKREISAFKSPSEAHPNYKTRLCVNFPLGKCTRGAACAYAHGESELRSGGPGIGPPLTQGQFYKTRMCNAFAEGRCTRGAACSYAHSETERLSHAGGVVKRDAKAGQDIRLEEKRKALAKVRGRSSSRSRSRSRSRREKPSKSVSSKPLPYIPGRRVDETDL